VSDDENEGKRAPEDAEDADADAEAAAERVAPTDADADAGEAKREDETEPEDGRPLFARTYPRHADLDALVEAFERGNYAHVRQEAPALAGRAEDPAVKLAAEDLFKRIQPDFVSKTLLVIAALLLVFFAYHYLGGHAHGGKAP
jgi:hypothetical protein